MRDGASPPYARCTNIAKGEFMTDFRASGAKSARVPRRSGIAPCEACGKPSDIAVGPDGGLSIADKKAGRVYRVTYRPR